MSFILPLLCPGPLPAAGPLSGPAASALAEMAADVPAPPAPAAASVPREWTVMVYVNGKNNLETFALDDVNEMERVGSSDSVNVVAELGRMNGYSNEEGDWKGVRRYYITKDTASYEIGSPVVQDLGKRDMGDWRELAGFTRWAKANYPAKRYMLIVWNHGSGWRIPEPPAAGRGISYDDETHNHITTPQLSLALREAGGVDVYASDACLMQMVEVAYEIKDSAAYIVGSEETEPAAGYPYDTLLRPLAASPGMGPEELSRLTVDAYSDYYKRKKAASTCSALKASAVEGLRGRVDEFAQAMMLVGDKDIFHSARKVALSYAFESNIDLYDLAELVGSMTRDPVVAGKAAALRAYISGELVLYNRYNLPQESGDDNPPWKSGARDGARGYDKSHGIAIYAPEGEYNADYDALAWAMASRWKKFIGWYNR